VQFWCGSAVTRALGRERVEALELGNGQRVPADLVVVGVGAIANSEWLADSGLELHRGLVCDQYGRTSDPHVFGAGDVVCRHIDGACRPTGHWTAAGDHARGVAALICGEDPMPIVEDNYFWSDQFDVRMQFVGVVPDAPRVTFVSGAPDEDAFVAICGGEHGGTAVFGVNSPRDFIRQSMPLRRGETLPVAA